MLSGTTGLWGRSGGGRRLVLGRQHRPLLELKPVIAVPRRVGCQVILVLRMCGEERRAVGRFPYVGRDAHAAVRTFEQLGVEQGLQVAFDFVDDLHLFLVVAIAAVVTGVQMSCVCVVGQVGQVARHDKAGKGGKVMDQ